MLNRDSKPLEFLARAQDDATLSKQVLEAIEKGGQVTSEAILQIAKSAGFSFSKEEFQAAVIRSLDDRFATGDTTLADVAGPNKPVDPPESSCAKGCLSYTKSWHPTRSVTSK